MAHTENTIKDLKKENLISLVLSLQSDRDKVIDTLGQRIDNLASTVDNLSSKLAQVELSLVVTKTVNDGSRIYINESLCPYYHGLWGKCKGLWQDKVIASFYTINGICELKNLSRINQ